MRSTNFLIFFYLITILCCCFFFFVFYVFAFVTKQKPKHKTMLCCFVLLYFLFCFALLCFIYLFIFLPYCFVCFDKQTCRKFWNVIHVFLDNFIFVQFSPFTPFVLILDYDIQNNNNQKCVFVLCIYVFLFQPPIAFRKSYDMGGGCILFVFLPT